MNQKKTNPELQQVIETLRHVSSKEGIGIWKVIAAELAGSTTKRRVVNLSRINRHAQKNEVVVVPGKVLGTGELTQPLTIAAYSFSKEAKTKIEQAKGKAQTLLELLQRNPKAKEVRIIG